MASISRVVVVDPRHELAGIVRGAVALLARQAVLVEVPGAEEALAEIERGAVDLLVTASSLPGDLDGVGLADRVSHLALGTRVIVLAEYDDPRPDPAVLEQARFQYYVRPAAEPFLRGIRAALEGLPAASVTEQVEPGADTLPDVPPVDLRAVRAIVLPLMRDVGAMGVVLVDRLGRVLIDEGATGYLDRERLAVALAPSFARTGQVGELVGGRAWAMHYYDGERLDLYALSLGLHYFLCLLFEGSNRAAMGAVAVFGRRAAEQIIERMGVSAFQIVEQAAGLAADTEMEREAVRVPDVAEEPVPAAAADALLLEPLPDSAFDPDALFTQDVDERLADRLFDPETLGEMAASFGPDEDEQVDLDTARDLGLLDEQT